MSASFAASRIRKSPEPADSTEISPGSWDTATLTATLEIQPSATLLNSSRIAQAHKEAQRQPVAGERLSEGRAQQPIHSENQEAEREAYPLRAAGI
jgi:hypothetical protein